MSSDSPFALRNESLYLELCLEMYGGVLVRTPFSNHESQYARMLTHSSFAKSDPAFATPFLVCVFEHRARHLSAAVLRALERP